MRLSPDPSVSPEAMAEGQRALVRDAAFASLTGALSGGVILVAFALGPMQIGLLAAIPLMMQAVQLPGIALVERLRQRRKIAVVVITLARLVILALALLPFVADLPNRLGWLIAAQFVICALGSLGACAVNSWLHQLIPRTGLGDFFAKRLFWGTAFACAGTLAAGLLVDHPAFRGSLAAYGWAFAAAGSAGLISSYYLARAPEPLMVPSNTEPRCGFACGRRFATATFAVCWSSLAHGPSRRTWPRRS